MGKFRTSLFIFRRDLRLEDNTGLLEALQNSDTVIPCFIFDPRQHKHPYFSNPGFSFMIDSLHDLQQQLFKNKGRLYVFEGVPHVVVFSSHQKLGIDAVFVNRDYTPFSIQRDASIEHTCSTLGIDFIACPDSLLNEPEMIHTKEGNPYTIYSHFYRAARLHLPRKVQQLGSGDFYNKDIGFCSALPEVSTGVHSVGGRAHALKILSSLRDFENYSTARNIPALSTTRLSPHNKFGTCSVREVYWSVCKLLGTEHTLIRELYWRDFFTHIAFHFPRVFTGPFHQKYAAIPWKKSTVHFTAWCDGRTGFPIVDAGMRELNSTGFMHNRVRMIVASFLVKDLHISWQEGERYFAQHLVDYDPCVNNGNWQWAASTGCDAQPYFRIFNPWLQQKKFDPECVYIKQWVPELQKLTPAQIHTLEHGSSSVAYPEPIVDHKETAAYAKSMFRL